VAVGRLVIFFVGNTLREGGGIYLRMCNRSARSSSRRTVNIRIAGNTISNTQGAWPPYRAGLRHEEPRPFGIGQIGIEVRENTLTANAKNCT